ncbi:MAG: hypothetical protein OEZ34_01030 [Spirochaetia bacterium]|nr:hypothetical protein [Spirochaetia bacterium]
MTIKSIEQKLYAKKEIVEDAYFHYSQTRDMKQFMETAAPYILHFIKKNLCRDEDIACDFFLHFYENSNKFMEKYEAKKSSPVAAFLLRYLKNEFLNFIRKIRNQNFTELTGMEIILSNTPSACSSKNIGDRIQIESLHVELSRLPLKIRLPLKMYYGIDLNLKELDFLANTVNNPQKTIAFLKQYGLKKEKVHTRQVALINRAARLNYLIQKGNENKTKLRRWFFLKKQTENRLKKVLPVTSLSELSIIFGINKSSMARRLKRALRSLEKKEKEVMDSYEEII